MTDRFDLSGKTAVVFGGAGLIGTALSTALSEHGAAVVVVDLDRDAGRELAESLGDECSYRSTDVTDPDAVETVLGDVASEHGSLDIFVNCSYPRNENYGQRYEEMTVEDWRENVDLHMNSYFWGAYCASLLMKEQSDGGSIINFGSTYGVQAPDFSVYDGTTMTSPVEYSAIKGGILNLTRYMASYLGEHDVRVNAVSPGGVYTGQHPDFVESYEARTPLDRMADPDDFGGAIVFLASDTASYVTGHNLRVDGGWTIC
jgi:NAD(P)-dependent dehydrogenase (short-subunit alcohol dehydrogenase family)